MKGDAIKLNLCADLGKMYSRDVAIKSTYNLIGSLLNQMNKGYGGIVQEDKKSETLKFYRKMQELHLKLSKCAGRDVNVVPHLDNIALEINKFVKVLEKQKSRPFGKSLLANEESIEELKEVTETLLNSRTAIMSSCTGAGGSTEAIKLNLGNLDRIKKFKYISSVDITDLLFNLLGEINRGYGDISQTDKKSETLKFYRKIQELYSKTLKLGTMNKKMFNHTSQELKDVVARIDEVALEINKFIKVLEKQKSRPFGKSKLANKESISTLKDLSEVLSIVRNLKWRNTTETQKVYAEILNGISKLTDPMRTLKGLLNTYEAQLAEVNSYEGLRELLENCQTSLQNFSKDIKKKYKGSST